MSEEKQNHRSTRTSESEKLMPSREDQGLAVFPNTGDPGDQPKEPYGLTEEQEETTESVRTSEGVNPSGAEPLEEEFIDEKLQRDRTL